MKKREEELGRRRLRKSQYEEGGEEEPGRQRSRGVRMKIEKESG